MLDIKNLSAGYGRAEIIHSVSLGIERGELVGVIGANGSGKSTLLKSVIGISSVFDGEILIDGKNALSMKGTERARLVSYLSQGRDVSDMSVYDTVLSGRFSHLSFPRRYGEEDERIARLAMERVGIESLSEQRMSLLSGGMRQRAYIAMALAQDTDYILLDEPMTYLDIKNQMSLIRLLRELAADGHGICAVMHDLTFAFSYCDRIIVLDDGRVSASGTPHELCRSDEIKKSFGITLAESEYGYYYSHNDNELM